MTQKNKMLKVIFKNNSNISFVFWLVMYTLPWMVMRYLYGWHITQLMQSSSCQNDSHVMGAFDWNGKWNTYHLPIARPQLTMKSFRILLAWVIAFCSVKCASFKAICICTLPHFVGTNTHTDGHHIIAQNVDSNIHTLLF